MLKFKGSITARLALGYSVLVAASIAAAAGVFYLGTVGVLERAIDSKITAISDRLSDIDRTGPTGALSSEVKRQLSDRLDSDTEIFLVLAPDGQPVTGNLTVWPDARTPTGTLIQRDIVRDGRSMPARLSVRPLSNGGRLIVGRDLSELKAIRGVIWRALAMVAAISLVLVASGAAIFRLQIRRRISNIRRTALEISAGDLSRRIPISGNDEFGNLNRDINGMLDRIQHLMEGVRHVSNAIAHDLRTPLSRIRNRLDHALHQNATADGVSKAARHAIGDIDELIHIFEKILQIAEAESGMRPEYVEAVDLNQIVADIVDLYDATAAERQLTLKIGTSNGPAFAKGDRNLLANALANLIDNAIKYAGPGAAIEVGTSVSARLSSIIIKDNGPGIPADELPKVMQRFYRIDRSRRLPGNGLGLAIVAAIATQHGGALLLSDAAPGLIARLELPREDVNSGTSTSPPGR